MDNDKVMSLPVETEYLTLGPVSATSSTDGQFVVVDYVNKDCAGLLRLSFPASALQTSIDSLLYIQRALADPTSGIHMQNPH